MSVQLTKELRDYEDASRATIPREKQQRLYRAIHRRAYMEREHPWRLLWQEAREWLEALFGMK